MITISQFNKDECCHITRRCSDCPDYCDINDKLCVLMIAEDCEVWREEREDAGE